MRFFTDDEISCVRLLTTDCRVATVCQIASAFFEDSVPRARGILSWLEKAGWLANQRLIVPEVPSGDTPVFEWPGPGSSLPEFNAGRISWLLAKRGAELKLRRQTIYWATKKAQRCFGRKRVNVQPYQLWHDLFSTQLLARRLRNDASASTRWVGDDAIKRCFPDLPSYPDALVLDDIGQVALVLEVGGSSYDAERLDQFHKHFSPFPYRIH